MIRQRGFTLIEMVVVVAIIGVLAAVVVPVVTSNIGESQTEAYKSDVQQVQSVVDLYTTRGNNPKFKGKTQLPILGAAKGTGTFYTADGDSVAEVIAGGISGNPVGGTKGGTPVWVDNGDGVRASSENNLNDEDAPGTLVGWQVTAVTSTGPTHYVDTRDFIIDFDRLIALGMMRVAPESASSDSCSTSTCSGSYIYYVKVDGSVETLLSSFPTTTKTGFQEAYP